MKIEINDLLKVKGIGKKLFERIKDSFDKNDYISKYNPKIHLEENSINLGDCLDLMNGIPDKSVDMVLADLPYGTTQNHWDSVIDLECIWKQYNRILKKNGVVVLFGQGLFSYELIKSNITNFKYKWIWEKNRPSGFLNAKEIPLRSHEEVLVFYKNPPKYNPQKFKGKMNHPTGIKATIGVKKNNNNYGTFTQNDNSEELGDLKYPRTVLKFDRPHPPIHPTQKPLDLLEYFIKTYTEEGDLVLDNTSGSSGVALASSKTNRRFICIEKEEEYYNLSTNRIKESEIG
jgi:site-specific DNA-methyltransferase (adenine-specific)